MVAEIPDRRPLPKRIAITNVGKKNRVCLVSSELPMSAWREMPSIAIKAPRMICFRYFHKCGFFEKSQRLTQRTPWSRRRKISKSNLSPNRSHAIHWRGREPISFHRTLKQDRNECPSESNNSSTNSLIWINQEEGISKGLGCRGYGKQEGVPGCGSSVLTCNWTAK